MKHFNRSSVAGATALAVAAFLTIAGSASNASLIDPDLAAVEQGGYAILGLQGAQIDLSSGPLVVNGNIGVGAGATLNANGGGHINGTIFADATATVNNSDPVTGGIVQPSSGPAQAQAAALNLASLAASLAPTQSFSQINTAQTINATTGLNVIAVGMGGINLSGGALVLNGTASQQFVLNIAGQSSLSGGSKIQVTGGLLPQNVVFNFTGTSGQFQTSSGNNATVGVFLAPNELIHLNGPNPGSGVDVSEFISGVGINAQSNTQFQALPPPSVPETNTLLPLLLVLGAAVGGPYMRRALA